jgi:hypothetical protein
MWYLLMPVRIAASATGACENCPALCANKSLKSYQHNKLRVSESRRAVWLMHIVQNKWGNWPKAAPR